MEGEIKEGKKIQFSVPSASPIQLDPRQVEMVRKTEKCKIDFLLYKNKEPSYHYNWHREDKNSSRFSCVSMEMCVNPFGLKMWDWILYNENYVLK